MTSTEGLEKRCRIYFYRLYGGVDEHGGPVVVDPGPLLAAVNDLAFDGEPDTPGCRRMSLPGGPEVCCWIDRDGSGGTPPAVRLGYLRHDDLPELASVRNGATRPLALQDGYGIVEHTHLLFMPDNVVAVAYNHFGPRPTRLLSYLRSKHLLPNGSTNMEVLLRGDAFERFQRMEGMRAITIGIRAEYANEVMADSGHLSTVFRTLRSAGQTGQIVLQLRPEPHKRRGRVAEPIAADARRLAADRTRTMEVATKFVVDGWFPGDTKPHELDLLSDKLVVQEKVLRHNKGVRTLDRDSVYDALSQAYQAEQESIKHAAGATLSCPADG